MRPGHSFALLILIAIWAPPARALSIVENSPYRTVEWFVADSHLIVRGVVKDVLEREVSRGNTFATVTLAVNETYKGSAVPAGSAITFTARNGDARVWREGGKSGGAYLFFLVDSAAHVASRPAAQDLATAWKAAPYAMRDHYAVAPIVMTGRPDQRLFAFTDGVRTFETADEVIEVVKAEVRRGSLDYRGEFIINFSDRSDMLKRAPATKEELGAYYHLTRLIIPLDRRAEAHAHRWIKSSDPTDRYNAARILAEFRSDRNVALLRGLLGDTFTADDFWPGSYSTFDLIGGERSHKWKDTPRPIRQFAWHALKQWGEAPPNVELGKPRYAATHLRRWHVVTPALVVVAPLVLVLARGWRQGRTRRPRLLAGVGGASLLLLLVVAAMWVRSRSHIHDLAVRGGRDARLEIAMLPGGVRVMSFEAWPDPFPAALTTAGRSAMTEQDWLHHDDNTKPVAGRAGRAGFYRDTGTIAGPGTGRGVAYRAWTIPYWAMAAAFGLPVAWRIGKVVKRRRELEQGLCPRCGYDLRATPHRCPECGTVFAPR